MRLRAPSEGDFTSPLRDDRVTARVGFWLGVSFLVAFVTGMLSHWAQDTPGWLTYPTGPVSLYRVSQGLHVLAGTAAVPLLLVKLWSVYPKLFARLPWPPSRRALVDGAERASIAVLVASAVFLLVTGVQNITHWYPWEFSFRSAHYAVAWVAIGSILLHVAVKLPIIRRALTAPLDADAPDAEVSREGAISRRGLLRTTYAAAGVAVLATAGQSVSWLRDMSIFAVRSGDGPQGVPINRSAEQAGVQDSAGDPSWRLTVVSSSATVLLTRADLEALPQRTRSLPIACVEGWSADATWTGVAVADLVGLVDAPAESEVFVSSLERDGAFATSTLPPQFTAHPDTLLALRLNGQTLSTDHGYPCRIITPTRPGVLQTKWVDRLEVLT